MTACSALTLLSLALTRPRAILAASTQSAGRSIHEGELQELRASLQKEQQLRRDAELRLLGLGNATQSTLQKMGELESRAIQAERALAQSHEVAASMAVALQRAINGERQANERAADGDRKLAVAMARAKLGWSGIGNGNGNGNGNGSAHGDGDSGTVRGSDRGAGGGAGGDHSPLRGSYGQGEGILGALKKAHHHHQNHNPQDGARPSAKGPQGQQQASRDEVARLQARIALLERSGSQGGGGGSFSLPPSANGGGAGGGGGLRSGPQQPPGDSTDIEVLRLLRPIVWAHEDEAWLEMRDASRGYDETPSRDEEKLRNRLRARVTSGEEAEQLRALFRGLEAYEALHGAFVYRGQDLRLVLRQMNLAAPPAAGAAPKEIFEMDEGAVRWGRRRSQVKHARGCGLWQQAAPACGGMPRTPALRACYWLRRRHAHVRVLCAGRERDEGARDGGVGKRGAKREASAPCVRQQSWKTPAHKMPARNKPALTGCLFSVSAQAGETEPALTGVQPRRGGRGSPCRCGAEIRPRSLRLVLSRLPCCPFRWSSMSHPPCDRAPVLLPAASTFLRGSRRGGAHVFREAAGVPGQAGGRARGPELRRKRRSGERREWAGNTRRHGRGREGGIGAWPALPG